MGGELLPLEAVRLGPGPLLEAQRRDVEYVLSLDVDRLLAPYRREAGLAPRSEGYGNWEADGMGGHVGGHALSALALLTASTGDPRVAERLDHLLDELQVCQDARDDGFLGGVPDGAALASELARGHLEADLFELNGRWVPLYNLHKTLSGLVDAAQHAHRHRALAMAVRLADWLLGALAPLDDAQVERLLHTEPGGLVEVLTALSALTGDRRYADGARRLLHRAVLDPLVQGRDALDGLHANTQIPKVVGYEVLGQATGDPQLLRAADAFWEHVVGRRTVAFGGNSVREHFHSADDFTTTVTDRQGPEGCNTVNMVELSVLQHLRTGRLEMVDYVERALWNHVLASQHPGHGGLVYFTPLRPEHYRVYSRPETSMWCCVGSGMEAHARHGAFLAVRGTLDAGTPTLDLLLHAAAVITDERSGLGVEVFADGLGPGRVTLRVSALHDRPGVLRVRRPPWSPEATAALVAGGSAHLAADDPAWFVLDLRGDREAVVELDLPADLTSERLPDGSDWASLLHGPLVLAARGSAAGLTGLRADASRMAHVAAGPLVPLAATPVISDLAGARVTGRGRAVVVASVPGADGEVATEVELEHLAAVHDQRYTVCWPVGDPAVRRAELAALDRATDDADVLDEVAAGEQQPESDHHLAGDGSSAGRDGTLHWRSATAGWFSYALRDPDGAAMRLLVRDRGAPGRTDEVDVDGVTVESEDLDAGPDGCVDRTYRLPAAPVPPGAGAEAPGVRVVRFTAAPGARTRDVVAVRLLR